MKKHKEKCEREKGGKGKRETLLMCRDPGERQEGYVRKKGLERAFG